MRKSIRGCLYVVLAYLSWHYTAAFCKAQTDGFSVTRVQALFPYNAKWEVTPPSEALQGEVQQVLSQPFYYLNRGGQCFAFVSQDGHYVLKFFKHRLNPPWAFFLQIPWLHKIRDKIFLKIDRDCTSYKIAYEEIPEETGVLYLHPYPIEGFEPSVAITDKLGITHTLALDHTAFLIQKCAEPVSLHFKRLKKQGDLAASKEAVHALVQTLIRCANKGIIDDDPGLHRNFGFVENTPMLIDVGRLKHENKEIGREDVKALTVRLRAFFKSKHPELVSLLDEEINTSTL